MLRNAMSGQTSDHIIINTAGSDAVNVNILQNMINAHTCFAKDVQSAEKLRVIKGI